VTSGSREHPFDHGRIAYVQIPAVDVTASAAFYVYAFGWKISGASKTHASFIDASENVLGAFVTDRAVSPDAGVILYVYVHGIDATLEKMVAAGSTVVKAPYPEGDIWVATLTDPAGNVIGIWQFSPR
jgi:predicted enzyme related to lactoylglutathione lyase